MTKRDLTAETAEDKFDVEAEAKRRGIQPYQVRATQAVGDRLVADLVADAYRGISQSASMIPPTREPPKPKGTGWVDAAPVTSPPGTSTIDAMCEAQNRTDRAAALRQRIENDWIEAQLAEKTTYRAKTEYDHLKRYDDAVPSLHREKE
jgi:hypothetical protein